MGWGRRVCGRGWPVAMDNLPLPRLCTSCHLQRWESRRKDHESTLQNPEAGRPWERSRVAFSPLPAPFRSLLLTGPPPRYKLLPLPTPAPSSRPPPTRGPRTGQPQPDSPTRARPPPLTLTRRTPRADTAHGREPRHASLRSGLGPSPYRGSGRGRHRGGESPREGRGWEPSVRRRSPEREPGR